MDKLFDYRYIEENTTFKIFIKNIELFEYLQQFGKHVYGKKITNDILNLPNDLLECFLQGYISADGYLDVRQNLYYCKTDSQQLALGLNQCVAKLYHNVCGLTIIPSDTDITKGKTVQSKEKYVVFFARHNIKSDKFNYDSELNGLWIQINDIQKSVEHIYKSEKPEAEFVLPVEKELVSETLAPINEPADAKPVNSRATAKKVLTDNILSFVMQKLGAKTFDRQKAAFGANATKIRLSILPEIFASIADTRKADRAVGKYRINSSNKDALALYLRINGNNRKFVNYLLKKRNVDNTRMFEVKDIIAMIDKAEAKIAADKKANPQYRARDARRYYNSLYEAKIQQYGKIKRQKNISTKA